MKSVLLIFIVLYSQLIPNEYFKTCGRIQAIKTQAAACMPPESKKKSIVKPSIKLKKINKLLLPVKGKTIINKI